MRILYIHQYFCTRQGRSGTRSYEFAKYLVQQGHRVTMLTSSSEISDLEMPPGRRVHRCEVDGIDVVIVRVPYSQKMSPLRRIASFLQFMLLSSWLGCRLRGHEVVLATSTPLTVGIPGVLASWFQKAPFVFEVRDLWPEAPIQLGVIRNAAVIWVLRRLERFLYSRSRHIITLSPGMFEGVLSAGVPKSKVSIIPNCADLELFQPGKPDPELVRKHDLEGRFVVLHAGSMGMANGLELLVEAAARLQGQGHDDIVFVMVGQGSTAGALHEETRRLGLRNLIFTGGLPRTQVADWVRTADACLVLFRAIPVLGTNSPNKLFDALSGGRPVIVNSDGWTKDLVALYEVGRVAVPGSASSLADEVLWLRDHPDARIQQGENARRLAEVEFDRHLLAEKLEAILLLAVAGRAPSGEFAVKGAATPLEGAEVQGQEDLLEWRPPR